MQLELPGTNAIRMSSATRFNAFCHIPLNVSSRILQPDSNSRIFLCIFLYHCFEGSTNKHIIYSSLKLIELFGKVCQEEGCGEEYHIINTIVGCCLTISTWCSNGHLRKWSSSERVTNSSVFLDNLDFATALVLSGNHFTKIHQFSQFFEMAVLSLLLSTLVYLSCNKQFL